MFDKMKQLFELQKKAKEMQRELEEAKFEKVSGDGKVRIVLNGNLKLEKVEISDSLLSSERKKELENILCGLISEAGQMVKEQMKNQAFGLMKNMNLNLPGA